MIHRYKNYTRHFLLTVSILYHLATSASAQVQSPKVILPSPTAASLGKYAEIPVSFHTGVPAISVPLYTLKEGTISIPISLSYHASGIRVSEVASWVGLGWSLNCGGVITRTVQHVPDEGPVRYNQGSGILGVPQGKQKRTGYYKDGYVLPADVELSAWNPAMSSWNNTNEGDKWFNYTDACLGNLDTEPDIFSYNIGGYSGKFSFKVIRNESGVLSRTAVFAPKADIKVTELVQEIQVPVYGGGTELRYTFAGFVMITPDGFKYTFGGANATEYSGSESYNIDSYAYSEYVTFLPTSWFLTRIDSPEGRYVEFEYTEDKHSFFDLAPETVWGGNNYLNLADQMLLRTSINGKRLSKITSTNEEILFQANTVREDLSNYENVGGTEQVNSVTTSKRLDRIEVKRKGGASFKKFDFGYGYFLSSDQGKFPKFLELLPSAKAQFVTDRKRLKLLSVTEKSGDEILTIPPHLFTYKEFDVAGQPLTLPRRISYQQDHWGNYNGATLNQSLIAFPVAPRNANRNSNENFVQIGVIDSIKNPTGGTTKFLFEPNQYIAQVEDEVSNASTTYPASTSFFSSGNTEVKVYFEIKSRIPDANSPCAQLGLECDRFYVDMSVSAGDPRLSTAQYDLDYAPYTSDPIAGIYKEDNTPIEVFHIGQLQYANCTDCNSDACGDLEENPLCSFQTTQISGGVVVYKTIGKHLPVNLPPGKYYVKALRIAGPKKNDATKNVMYTSSVTIQIPASADANYQPPVHSATLKGAGIRIAKISVSDGISNVTQERVFTYPNPGLLFGKPTYRYLVEYTAEGLVRAQEGLQPAGPMINELWSSSSVLPMQNTQGSALGYDIVRESRPGNGYSEYTYDVSLHSYAIDSDPYFQGNSYQYSASFRLYNFPVLPAPTTNFERGNLLRTETFNNSGIRLTRTDSEYEIGNTTLDFHGTKVQLIETGISKYLSATHYPIFSGTSRLLSTTETMWDQNGQNPKVIVTNYKYEGLNHLQTTEVKRSLGTHQEVERMIYPPDYGNIVSITGGVKNLQAINLINVPIEKYSMRQDNDGNNMLVTGGTLTTYKESKGLINEISALKVSTPIALSVFNYSNKTQNTFSPDPLYESKLKFVNYDVIGNITEVSKTNDFSTAYIWGYNNSFPIAEIKNAKSSEVFYTSFEEETTNTSNISFTGVKGHTGTFQVVLPSAGTYKVTYWKKEPSGDWQFFETSLSSTTTIGSSTGVIDELRLYPTRSTMTTYTYDPLIGTSSATDANGIRTQYQYDALGRLVIVQDNKQNIVKHVKYHYQGQE